MPDQHRFEWIDVIGPTEEELQALALKYNIHPTSIQDCLDPEHLPKFERIGDVNFIILRVFDDTSNTEADTVQELTRKVAIFVSNNFLLTVHRKDQPFLIKLRDKWKRKLEHPGKRSKADLCSHLLSDLMREVFTSYEKPIDDGLNQLEQFEMGIFEAQGAAPFHIQQGYYLKRRASVFKRILRLSHDVLLKATASIAPNGSPYLQDLRESLDSLYFYCEELVESIQSLLNQHLSLASHRTNEVMRLLTVFSVFFLPLNFIASIYGMNFEHMPELKWRFGYPSVIATMISVGAGIFFWVRHNGWLKRRD